MLSSTLAYHVKSDETKFHHETEEITRVLHRERHTHEVHIHELVSVARFKIR